MGDSEVSGIRVRDVKLPKNQQRFYIFKKQACREPKTVNVSTH